MVFKHWKEEFETDSREYHAKNARFAFLLFACIGVWVLAVFIY